LICESCEKHEYFKDLHRSLLYNELIQGQAFAAVFLLLLSCSTYTDCIKGVFMEEESTKSLNTDRKTHTHKHKRA